MRRLLVGVGVLGEEVGEARPTGDLRAKPRVAAAPSPRNSTLLLSITVERTYTPSYDMRANKLRWRLPA